MKHLLLLAFLWISSAAAAQTRIPVVFYLKDGSEMSGYLKPFYHGAKKFEYSDGPEGKLQKMELNRLHRMLTTEGEHKFLYELVDLLDNKTHKKTNTLMLQVMVTGYMTLYYYNGEVGQQFIKPSPDAPGAYLATNTYGFTPYKSEKTNKKINDRLIKNVQTFFQDHPEISQEFAEGKADFTKVVTLVKRYNEFKAQP
jgi:hypothetical protein